MPSESRVEPITTLLIEDNPGDAQLTELALKRARVLNRLSIVEDCEAGLALLQGGKEVQWPRAGIRRHASISVGPRTPDGVPKDAPTRRRVQPARLTARRRAR